MFFMVPAVRESSRGKAKGGLIVALNKEVFMSRLVSSDSELIVVSFIFNGLYFLLISVYIFPLTDINNFLNKFNCKMSELRCSFNDALIIVGWDFNCRVGNLNSYDCCVIPNQSFTPARVSSVIDFVWGSLSSSPFLRDFRVLEWGTLSDHLPVAVCVEIPSQSPEILNQGAESVKLEFDIAKVKD